MKILLFLILLNFIFPLQSQFIYACDWDSDTLEMELKGLPGIKDIITGKFDRYPPLYYQMRVHRIMFKSQNEELSFEDYDDIAVAFDKLGDASRALDWIDKKNQQLNFFSDKKSQYYKESLYKYYANVGTFQAHYWFKNDSADKSKPEMLLKAAENIIKGLEINPNAHFGREKYQLFLILQLIKSIPMDKLIHLEILNDNERQEFERAYKEAFAKDLLSFSNIVISKKFNSTGKRLNLTKEQKKEKYSHAILGLTGIITLGAGWKSVDIFRALADILVNKNDSVVAGLALMRVDELMKDGLKSILTPEFNGTDSMTYWIRERIMVQDQLDKDYPLYRKEADKWLEKKNNLILAKLEKGEHPDTDRDFWQGIDDRLRFGGLSPAVLGENDYNIDLEYYRGELNKSIQFINNYLPKLRFNISLRLFWEKALPIALGLGIISILVSGLSYFILRRKRIYRQKLNSLLTQT